MKLFCVYFKESRSTIAFVYIWALDEDIACDVVKKRNNEQINEEYRYCSLFVERIDRPDSFYYFQAHYQVGELYTLDKK